jgi:hypothetical protein
MNNEKRLFYERQRIKQWWIWIILSIAPAVFLCALFLLVLFDIEFGNNPAGIYGLSIGLSLTSVFFIAFLFVRMETIIDDQGISLKYRPFHRTYKFYAFEDVDKAFIREYNPVLEYGGWGLRGVHGDKVYNVSGKLGLQLVFKDRTKLLIGTQRAKEIETILVEKGFEVSDKS